MKKFLSLILVIFLLSPLTVKAESQPELRMMRATAYCIHGITKSGEHTRPGICAMRKEEIGKTAIVYQRLPGNEVGEIIGIFEVKDTGQTEGLLNGNVIDCWYPDMDACQAFMNRVYEDGCQGKVFVQLVEADG